MEYEGFSRQGLRRTIDERSQTVTYTYRLREYRGQEEYPSSDRIVHGSLTCRARTIFDKGVYENGTLVATIPGKPEDLLDTSPMHHIGLITDGSLDIDELVPPGSPGFLQVLHTLTMMPYLANDYLWVMDADYGRRDQPVRLRDKL